MSKYSCNHLCLLLIYSQVVGDSTVLSEVGNPPGSILHNHHLLLACDAISVFLQQTDDAGLPGHGNKKMQQQVILQGMRNEINQREPSKDTLLAAGFSVPDIFFSLVCKVAYVLLPDFHLVLYSLNYFQVVFYILHKHLLLLLMARLCSNGAIQRHSEAQMKNLLLTVRNCLPLHTLCVPCA
jgi:hypothetical protein